VRTATELQQSSTRLIFCGRAASVPAALLTLLAALLVSRYVPSELDAATLPRGFFERQKDVFSLKKNSLGAAALAADAAGAQHNNYYYY
jgi:hypothetical protein